MKACGGSDLVFDLQPSWGWMLLMVGTLSNIWCARRADA
jgi:hypothetical protein